MKREGKEKRGCFWCHLFYYFGSYTLNFSFILNLVTEMCWNLIYEKEIDKLFTLYETKLLKTKFIRLHFSMKYKWFVKYSSFDNLSFCKK